ncbi:MAG TPA: hypothetical protein VES66_06840 [Terriglobales bacterium]|nr:hypothetical protein [Terriglobales bacterium]
MTAAMAKEGFVFPMPKIDIPPDVPPAVSPLIAFFWMMRAPTFVAGSLPGSAASGHDSSSVLSG